MSLDDEKFESNVLTCKCGRGDRCPVATVNEDNSVTLVDEDGPVPQTIHLQPEAAQLFKRFLNKKI